MVTCPGLNFNGGSAKLSMKLGHWRVVVAVFSICSESTFSLISRHVNGVLGASSAPSNVGHQLVMRKLRMLYWYEKFVGEEDIFSNSYVACLLWFHNLIYRILIITATNRNGQNLNGHKPKRPQTETATNRNGHRPEWPQTETATNRNGHSAEQPQTETATNRNGHK